MRLIRLIAIGALLLVLAFLWGDAVYSPSGAYGQLWEEGSSARGLNTANVFAQWVTATPGKSRLTNLSNWDITIDTEGSGLYLICMAFSFTGSLSTTYQFAVFVDGVYQSAVSCQAQIGASAEIQNVASCGLVALGEGQVIDARISANLNTRVISIRRGSLTVARVGVD